MIGAFNFRDLGGYAADGGRTVKWGMVFRSDDLYQLTDTDRQAVTRLNIRTVVDFRDRLEVERTPDLLPDSVQEQVNIPIEAGKLMVGLSYKDLTRQKATGILVSVYRALAHDFQDSYRQFFKLLADSRNVPLLFHCTAGKDRTGFAAALFLSALGVARETILADYMLSNEYLATKYLPGIDYNEELQPLFGTAPEFLGAAFEVVDGGYGGPENYLREALGVDIGYFRETFTE